MKRIWLLLICYTFSPMIWADEALNSFLNNLQTMYGRFEQKLFNEKGKLIETSYGEMYIQRPNKFHWDYQKPYKQLIVADGKKVWLYDKDLEQVTVKNFDQALGKTPALLLSRGGNVEEDFTVTTLDTRAGSTRIELKPKNDHVQFERMRLNLQGQQLQGLELTDNLGQTTFITFNQTGYNHLLKGELFVFTPPKGVDIVEDKP